MGELATTNKELSLAWDESKYKFQVKLGNFVQYFQVNLPTNAHGVPLQLINPVGIVEHLLTCETTDDVPDEAVEQATFILDFDDGIPTLEGLPIWERFEGETLEYYSLFKHYREMPYNEGSRAMSKLSAARNIPGRSISALSKIYHWQLRCRAYDAYKKTELHRRRQLDIEKLEGKHTATAEKLLAQSMEYLENHPEQMNPKLALQMVQVAMKAGRLALGLNPDKPGDTNDSGSTNINIQQNSSYSPVEATGTANTSSSVQQGVDYLQSVVHILDQSGALDKAKGEILEAEFSESVE